MRSKNTSSSDEKKNIVSGVVPVSEILEYLRNDYYMSKKEAAKYTGLCSDTLDYHSLVVGDLKRYKLSGKVLYKKSDLDRFVESYLDVTTKFDPDQMAEKVLQKLKKKMEKAG